jgi:hypothetical protein
VIARTRRRLLRKRIAAKRRVKTQRQKQGRK